MQQSSQLTVQAGAGRRARRITGLFVACVVVASGSVFAQGTPDPRTGASTPVQVVNTVANPVPVTGSVSGDVSVISGRIDATVLNDVVTTPYLVSRSGAFGAGSLAPFGFDVPDGMRLIVETITVRYALDSPGNAVTQMSIWTASGFFASGEIALQQQGDIADVFGTKYWLVGTHTGKLRIDAAAGRQDELTLFSRLPTVSGTANMLVAGYLVPVP